MENSTLLGEKEAIYGCLASQHGLGYAGMAQLLGHFGSPEAVYAADPQILRVVYPRLSAQMATSLRQGPDRAAWVRLVEQCAALNIGVTAPHWPEYPGALRTLEAPPPLLYVRGEWREEDARSVALVGTRTPTAYGREAAFALARDAAAAGYTVVSGLALGIDAAAHAGALDAGGRTVAVIGCGLDFEYPVENLAVRARIEAQGAVFSEFPPGAEPFPSNFPRRNRLISALSLATVVVEAGGKSGALLTAAHARNQHKPLFAVPGPIFSAVSEGTNALLRKGALLAASAQDIFHVLEGGPVRAQRGRARGTIPPAQKTSLSVRASTSKRAQNRAQSRTAPESAFRAPALPLAAEVQDPVLRLWGADEACALDTLAARAVEHNVWPQPQVAAALLESLLMLEMRGRVQRLPGAVYRRTLGQRR